MRIQGVPASVFHAKRPHESATPQGAEQVLQSNSSLCQNAIGWVVIWQGIALEAKML